MDSQPDARTLKEIYEAERQAERIVREAEEEAAALLQQADAEADALREAAKRRLSLRRRETLDERISASEREAAELLENERTRVERWFQDRVDGIERIADRLLTMVLPS